jgi:starch synthase
LKQKIKQSSFEGNIMALNFTFNPNFRPSDSLNLTPPPTLQPSRPVARNPLPVLQTQISPEALLRISAYHRAAVAASQAGDEIGKKLNSFRLFIRDLENPNISNPTFVLSFKQQFGNALFLTLCEEVAHGLTGRRDVEAGERILNENFRSVLRIKNYDGKNLLNQIESFFAYQLENHRGNVDLNSIGEMMEKYTDHLQQAGRSPLGGRLLEDAARLKTDATNTFKSLPEQAKGVICKRIYELDGSGNRSSDYGYQRALEDIERIFRYQGESPLQRAIAHCSDNAPRAPSFTISYIHNESIKLTDSQQIVKEVRKLYQLEELTHFLSDAYKHNDFIAAKYLEFTPELRDLINQSVWLACYQPLDPAFGQNFVVRNPRALLGIRNQQGVDIVMQLIAHQQEKILALRLHEEVIAFNNASQNKNSAQILEIFNQLSDKAKEDFRTRVWNRDSKPELSGWQNFFGGWGYYGTRKIEADPLTLFTGYPVVITEYLNYLREKVITADAVLLEELKRTVVFPQGPIDVSTTSLENEPGLVDQLPADLRVAYVTAEFAGVASIGGLSSAVDGMVRGLGAENARVIMPLYQNGVIQEDVLKSLQSKNKYEITVDGKSHRVYKTNINGVRCYLIDDPQLFWIPKKEDGTAGDFYDGEFHHVKHRWAVFQSAAAELVYKFSKKSKPVQAVHLHDAQTGLIPKFMAARHPEEWKRGETPAMMFTVHNNLDPQTYDHDQSIDILHRHGLPREGRNSIIEAMRDSDMVTTVSKKFGEEVQTPTFGNGMDHYFKTAARQGKLVGIVNGNSNGFNPAKDLQLQNWKSVIDGPSKGTTPDLRFGPDSPDLADKIVTSQREVCAYLKSLPYEDDAYANLDPEKPIIMYLGRFDSGQKGIEKLRLIMEETVKNGGQFVCIGTRNPSDHYAKKLLDEMRHYAKEHHKKGVLILEDKKENGQLKYQSVFGKLLRAAATMGIFPSKIEPCGLVQGEFNSFGKKAIATRTGGFADTLTTEGPNANGYLFKRCDEWYSQEQEKEIIATLQTALTEAKAIQHALYHGDAQAKQPYVDSMRTIMRNAHNSTWEKTPDGSLSAIRRLDLAMAKAFANRKTRGQIPANLKTLKI